MFVKYRKHENLFASNKSFSALVGVKSGFNTCSHSCDLAVIYKLLLKPSKSLSSLSVGEAVSSLLIPFLKLVNFCFWLDIGIDSVLTDNLLMTYIS